MISTVIYVDLVLAQLMLAARWGRWRPWLLASAAATAAALIAFGANTSGPDAGILQRVAVSIPLAAITAIAVRLLKSPATQTPGGQTPGTGPTTVNW